MRSQRASHQAFGGGKKVTLETPEAPRLDAGWGKFGERNYGRRSRLYTFVFLILYEAYLNAPPPPTTYKAVYISQIMGGVKLPAIVLLCFYDLDKDAFASKSAEYKRNIVGVEIA